MMSVINHSLQAWIVKEILGLISLAALPHLTFAIA
jgi:hypothetical protein